MAAPGPASERYDFDDQEFASDDEEFVVTVRPSFAFSGREDGAGLNLRRFRFVYFVARERLFSLRTTKLVFNSYLPLVFHSFDCLRSRMPLRRELARAARGPAAVVFGAGSFQCYYYPSLL